MKKILFIVPMHLAFDSFINPPSNARNFMKKDGKYYNSLATDLPLGPLSMSSYLKKHIKVDVRLIDFNVEINSEETFPFKSFYDYCKEFLNNYDYNPDIIGVSSLFSPSFNNFLDCGKVAKTIFKSSFVIGGGNIPTNSYKYIYSDLDCDFYDALCYGEGEKPLLELLKSKNKKKYISNSSSWITREKVREKKQLLIPKHNFINDLDEIPFYDYDLPDPKKHGVNPVMSAYATLENQKGFHIMTSRGCPFLCTFCASHKVHGRKMRYHSVERIRKDLITLKQNYGANTIIFQDDHFMGDRQRVIDILEIIGELKLEAIFQNGLTLYALDKSMLEAFYNAGVRQLVLPVESGSEKVLKEQMKKPLKLAISQRVANDCRDIGIYTNSNILIGMPGETKDDIEIARKNLKTINTNWFHIVCASPIVGSEIHKISFENNFISGDTLGADYRKAVIDTKDFKSNYIQEMQYKMNLELNFVYNNDMKLKQYQTALKGFNNTIRVKKDHCFAHYFSSICYEKMNKTIKAKDSMKLARKYSKDSLWKKHIKDFKIKELFN